MGLSGDWRDTRWGHAIYGGIMLAITGVVVATDGQFSALVRASGVVAGSLGLLMVVYSVLRLTRLLPRRGPGRRRLGKDADPRDSGQ